MQVHYYLASNLELGTLFILPFALCPVSVRAMSSPRSTVNPAKNWVFTVNNYTDDHERILRSMDYQYLLFGREVAPTTGTPHLQGYVQFKKKLRRTALVKLLPCWWEVARGDVPDQAKYCSKDGDVVELGTPRPVKGGAPTMELRIARNKRLRDTPNINELLNDGTLTMNQVPCLEKARLICRQYDRMFAPPAILDGELPHLWLYGPRGTGKSLHARSLDPNPYLKNCNKWWDLYNGQPTVLIEDFDKRHECLVPFLKLWADRYPFNGEVKGGSAGNIRPNRVIVTSNYHPRDIWPSPNDLEPIERRFTIVHFPKIEHSNDNTKTIIKKERASRSPLFLYYCLRVVV